MRRTTNNALYVNLETREKNEAAAFDKEVLSEFGVTRFEELKDKDLFLSNELISAFLNVMKPPVRAYQFALYQLQNIQDKRVLDYCAGTCESTVIIAKKGPKFVDAFDISPLAIKIAKKRMEINNINNLVKVQVIVDLPPKKWTQRRVGDSIISALNQEVSDGRGKGQLACRQGRNEAF